MKEQTIITVVTFSVALIPILLLWFKNIELRRVLNKANENHYHYSRELESKLEAKKETCDIYRSRCLDQEDHLSKLRNGIKAKGIDGKTYRFTYSYKNKIYSVYNGSIRKSFTASKLVDIFGKEVAKEVKDVFGL